MPATIHTVNACVCERGFIFALSFLASFTDEHGSRKPYGDTHVRHIGTEHGTRIGYLLNSCSYLFVDELDVVFHDGHEEFLRLAVRLHKHKDIQPEDAYTYTFASIDVQMTQTRDSRCDH